MNQYDIESARKALDEIKDIVRDRDSARASIKEMREIENEMARRHADEVDARIAEIKDLEAQLAARPVVESEKAMELRAALRLNRNPDWWYELNQRAREAITAWLAAPPTEAPPAETTLMLKRLDGQPPLYVHGTKEAIEYVQKMIAMPAQPDDYTRLAVAYAEAMAEDGPTDFDAAWLPWKAAYDARQRGEHVTEKETEKEKPAPHQPETVDVWLAMDHRRMIAWCSDLNKAKQWTSATRFVRVRLPVVEVVENEKGGA